VLFFFQGTPDQGAEFFRRHWPDARAVSDPELFFHEAFGARRGSLRQLLGPRVWFPALRALFKGNLPGRIIGDARVMPAMLLVRSDEIVWRHNFRHAGDHPEYCAFGTKAPIVVPARSSA
jgi:hypothetical protein